LESILFRTLVIAKVRALRIAKIAVRSMLAEPGLKIIRTPPNPTAVAIQRCVFTTSLSRTTATKVVKSGFENM
jgi:hypothetical protein